MTVTNNTRKQNLRRVGKAAAIALIGLQPHPVTVEARVGLGLPAFQLVGLPDASLKEAKSRVEAAVQSSGINWDAGRITVNLSPAELPKTGSGFDLAIALAVLAARQPALQSYLNDTIIVGELGLDGTIRPVRGILPTVIGAYQLGYRKMVVPAAAQAEASLIPGIEITAVNSLVELLNYWLKGERPALETEDPETVASSSLPGTKREDASRGAAVLASSRADRSPSDLTTASEITVDKTDDYFDLAQVRGQMQGRWALEVAAAGGHHLLYIGQPGTGKTLLARCLPGILPDLSSQEALAVTAVHSLAGTLRESDGLITSPPFIAPHHCASLPSLVGGGSLVARPGAISLAHHGVLFLDEAAEFAPRSLDALREPLETGIIEVHRLRSTAKYPAQFQLILAANPCPCGNALSENATCKCTPFTRSRYLNRLSGPLLDRVDLQCVLYPPSRGDLTGKQRPEGSEVVKERVLAARERQKYRWRNYAEQLNARVPNKALTIGLPTAVQKELDSLTERGRFSLRGANRLLRIAYTLADLAGQDYPTVLSVRAAVSLRQGPQSN